MADGKEYPIEKITTTFDILGNDSIAEIKGIFGTPVIFMMAIPWLSQLKGALLGAAMMGVVLMLDDSGMDDAQHEVSRKGLSALLTPAINRQLERVWEEVCVQDDQGEALFRMGLGDLGLSAWEDL